MGLRLRISLATKCQLLFGAAIAMIIAAALAVGWVRMQTLVLEGHEEVARRLAQAWTARAISPPDPTQLEAPDPAAKADPGVRIRRFDRARYEEEAKLDAFRAAALERFMRDPSSRELFREVQGVDGESHFRYARALRRSELAALRGETTPATPAEGTPLRDPLELVIEVRMRADHADHQLLLNRVYIITAGVLAGLLAIGTFWFLTTRIFLSPIRVLRDTAEKVAQGDLNIRSDINTGDEFEHLAQVFNQMLEGLKRNEDQLRSANQSLDLRVGELSATNLALHEANKIKGEFLANVSHELRTPLNSILGFAELLLEVPPGGAAAGEEKRRRYLHHITESSRSLLALITDLLDLAKIEAGRMELSLSPLSVGDAVEGLVNLIRPQAQKRGIELRLSIARGLPEVETDARKFQQVLFNFLSNAVKFTPPGGEVEVSAALWPMPGDQGAPRVRVSVRDTGPGIPPERQREVFEKFQQLDTGVAREHEGTGLGLAIARELTRLIGGEIELESELGRGSTFSLVVPVRLEASPTDAPPSAAPAPESGSVDRPAA